MMEVLITIGVLFVGAVVGIGTLVIFVRFLAHVQNVDSPPDWRNFRPNDSLGGDSPSTPQEAQESPYPK